MSGKPVHRIASEAGSYASQPVFVYVRFLRDVVYRAQVIIHAMSAVVGADFFQPFHAEARQSAAVGSDDDVIVSRHNLQVPAVAPELADGALRSAFAEEEGRVFLVRVEIDGIEPSTVLVQRDSTLPFFSWLKIWSFSEVMRVTLWSFFRSTVKSSSASLSEWRMVSSCLSFSIFTDA